ncbi:hypothetical protein JOQ06_015562, partial [Pogonophryne albipinna]
ASNLSCIVFTVWIALHEHSIIHALLLSEAEAFIYSPQHTIDKCYGQENKMFMGGYTSPERREQIPLHCSTAVQSSGQQLRRLPASDHDYSAIPRSTADVTWVSMRAVLTLSMLGISATHLQDTGSK